MVYNTPYQDLVAVRSIIQRFLKEYEEEWGVCPDSLPGIYFNSTEVGLQFKGFRSGLVTRKHSRETRWQSHLEFELEDECFYSPFEVNLVREVLEEIAKQNIPVRKQAEEIAKALRFRLDLI